MTAPSPGARPRAFLRDRHVPVAIAANPVSTTDALTARGPLARPALHGLPSAGPASLC